MPHRMRRTTIVGLGWLLAAVVLLGALVCGCSDDKKLTGPDDGWPSELRRPDSPEDVLYNLQQAYRHKNVAWYDSVLYDGGFAAADSFVFEFVPDTWFDPAWDRVHEVTAARTMFGSPRIEDITISLTHSGAVPVAGQEGQKSILVTFVYLNIEYRAMNNDLTQYRVSGDQAFFRFKPQWIPATGDTLWRIVYWQDRRPYRVGSSMPTTWGELKAVLGGYWLQAGYPTAAGAVAQAAPSGAR